MSRQVLEDGSHRILVVGNFILRRGIASVVSGLTARASILEASCFRDGKASLQREEFSAAFFQIDGEEQNGPVDFQMIRADLPQLILAVLSRADSAGVILRYLAAGVNGCILDSSSQSEIERAIVVVLQRVTYIPPGVSDGNTAQPKYDPSITRVCRSFRGLTGRQTAVLRLLLKGYSNKEVARLLGLSPDTVKIHVGALLRHFSVQTRSDLLILASQDHDNLSSYAAA